MIKSKVLLSKSIEVLKNHVNFNDNLLKISNSRGKNTSTKKVLH